MSALADGVREATEPMKAIVLTHFGPPDNLRLEEVPKPTARERELLVRVRATTVSAGDCDVRGMHLPLLYRGLIGFFLRRARSGPLILGQELSGDVEAVGPAITRFRPGDAVIAWTGFRLGGYAEYACVRETGSVAAKPSRMTYEEAAPLAVGGLEAADMFRRALLRPGEEVLVVGAGGSIGTFFVQLAKTAGARVTGVDRPEKLDMLRSLGADSVVDYTREDVTKRHETFDVVFDVAGKVSPGRGMRLLRPGGRYLMGNPRMSHRVRARWAARKGQTVLPYASKSASETEDDFRLLQERIEAGKLVTVIDRRYPFEQTAEAHRYVETGLKKGNVVLTVDHGDARA